MWKRTKTKNVLSVSVPESAPILATVRDRDGLAILLADGEVLRLECGHDESGHAIMVRGSDGKKRALARGPMRQTDDAYEDLCQELELRASSRARMSSVSALQAIAALLVFILLALLANLAAFRDGLAPEMETAAISAAACAVETEASADRIPNGSACAVLPSSPIDTANEGTDSSVRSTAPATERLEPDEARADIAEPSAVAQSVAHEAQEDGAARSSEPPHSGPAAFDAAALAADPAAAMAALKGLETARQTLSQGGLLTQEMLADLPHDLARNLREAGLVASGGTISRLPAAVIDRYRDRNGIATIPEADTWTAAGGRVVLPLPGGGNISKPEDLESFGLEP